MVSKGSLRTACVAATASVPMLLTSAAGSASPGVSDAEPAAASVLQEETQFAPTYDWSSWSPTFSCKTSQAVMMMTYAQPGYHSHRYKSSSGSIQYHYGPNYSSYYTSTSTYRVAQTSYKVFDHRLTYSLYCAQR